MATSTAPRRLWPALLAAGFAATLVLGACSSSKDEGSAPGSTTASSAAGPSSTAGGSGSTGNGSSGTTADDGAIPSSPSTLPAGLDGTCAAMADTLGLKELQPRNTASWPDERQRVVTDARLEAELLGTAQKSAPASVAGDMAQMQSYATWLAGQVEGAGSFDAAVQALQTYPDSVSMALANASVQSWTRANC